MNMSSTASGPWLFFLFNLPGTRASERVKVWRRLKKFGALQLKTSAYVLPDEPTHYERFQWLGKEVVDMGGEATLARVAELEGMPRAAVVALFNNARSKDYDEIAETLALLIKDQKARKANPDAFVNQLQKLKGRFQEIQAIDYFQCSRGEDVQMLFQKAAAFEAPTKKLVAAKRLQVADYKGKLWLTRPRPEIDRVGSAWLIRKFIDPEARFTFAETPTAQPAAIPYDMLDVEFSHHGDCCTFETLIERFGIRDRAVRILAELIHDADLEDDKFHRVEGFGVERIFKGWAKQGLSDQEILSKGFDCFDGLYAEFKRS
ncbi:MAG: chromate resistance protein [Verrucomicrobia bacterium]|nr:chromate resistance protein [Verrucomicrobiota bacterium]